MILSSSSVAYATAAAVSTLCGERGGREKAVARSLAPSPLSRYLQRSATVRVRSPFVRDRPRARGTPTHTHTLLRGGGEPNERWREAARWDFKNECLSLLLVPARPRRDWASLEDQVLSAGYHLNGNPKAQLHQLQTIRGLGPRAYAPAVRN